MMPAFQQFQHDFGRHLRDPRQAARPAGVPARRARIYGELLYNNLEGFLLACFPISQRLLGQCWPRLVRAFFCEARCQTPYFREIPREFLHWLLEAEVPVPLPTWWRELAHYEWAELAVDIMDVSTPGHDVSGDLMAGRPLTAPALLNLSYQWPVHRIGTHWRPRKPQPVHLLVYRDPADAVRFMELNPVSARLVALLVDGACTGEAACGQIASELQHPDPGALLSAGRELLESLRAAGAIYGVRT